MKERHPLRVLLGTTLLLLQGFGVAACSTDAGSGDSKAAAGAAGTPGSSGSGSSSGGSGAQPGGTSAGGAGGTSTASDAGATSKAGAGSGAGASGGGAPGTGGGAASGCDSPGLTWKTARKTWYTSYPDPGSEECVAYNGCEWAGQFSACDDKKPEAWVKSHNIVAAFPDFDTLALHDLCLKSGDKTLVVTVLDTCGDSDCDGCCTENKGNADELIDLESYTNERFGIEDGQIQWADLGPTRGGGCD